MDENGIPGNGHKDEVREYIEWMLDRGFSRAFILAQLVKKYTSLREIPEGVEVGYDVTMRMKMEWLGDNMTTFGKLVDRIAVAYKKNEVR
jgi:hypothetical protein